MRRGKDKKGKMRLLWSLAYRKNFLVFLNSFIFEDLRCDYPFDVNEYMGEAGGESGGGDQEAWNSDHKQISFTVFQTLSILDYL